MYIAIDRARTEVRPNHTGRYGGDLSRLLVVVCLLGELFIATASRAEDRSSLRPAALSLPTGPGSIAGLGDALMVNASQGTASYRVPIALPAGAGGHRPSLVLSYNGGAAAGEVGIGWSLGLPVIERSVRHGLPGASEGRSRYSDGDRLLVRGIDGAGELVAMNDGTFRLDPEEGFLRASAANSTNGLDAGIAVEAPDGRVYAFGVDANSRVVGPAGTFAWHLSFIRDVHGHVIRFEYDNAANFPRLLRVLWNLNAGDALQASVTLEWEARPDAIRSYRSGARSALESRVRTIVVRRGANVHRTLSLSYADDAGLSRLSQVELVGWDGTKAPTLSFGYADDDMAAAELHAFANPPGVGFQGQSAELSDLDGNSLPDLIEMDPDRFGGAYRVFYNQGGSFSAPVTLTGTPSVWLGAAGKTSYLTQWLDADGDSRADIVAASLADGGADANLRYFPNQRGTFGSAQPRGGAGSSLSPFQSGTRLTDLDLDHRPDLIRSGADGMLQVSFGATGWSTQQTVGALPDASLSLSNAAVKLLDLNGDRLDDLAIQAGERLVYYPGTGFGAFEGTPTRVTGLPAELTELEFAEAQLRDMTGDGLPDLVHLGIRNVRIWPMEGTDRFAAQPTLVSTLPARDTSTTEVRLVDVNGNGTSDILWVDVVHPDAAGSWLYVDLLEGGSPALLRQVDNGLGARTSLAYAGMGEMSDQASRAQLSAPSHALVPMMVLAQKRVEDGLSLNRVDRYTYAGGLFDGTRREFLGFAQVRTDRLATGAAAPDGRTAIGSWRVDEEYELGQDDHALAGRLLRRAQSDVSGFVFQEEAQHHVVVSLNDTASDGTKLRRGFLKERISTVRERESDDPVAVTRVLFEPDRLGFVARETNYGLVDPNAIDNTSLGHDETVHEKDYIHDLDQWRIGSVASERTANTAGDQVAASRHYYDDLPLGQVGARGLISAEEVWIEGEQWSRVAVRTYDDHGQVLEERGAEGQHSSTRYDPTGTYLGQIVRETGNPALPTLVWTASFDPAAGDLLASVSEPDGGLWRLHYDGLGRVTARFAPDDPDRDPSTRYEYFQSAPISAVTTYRALAEGQVGRSRVYQNGLGESLETIAQARDDVWQVTGAVTRNALGWVTDRYEPFEVSAAPAPTQLALPPTGQPSTAVAFDDQQREVSSTDPRGGRTLQVFGARSVKIYDPLDVLAGLANASPTVRWKDGQGRLVQVVERGAQLSPAPYDYEYDAAGRVVRADDAHDIAMSLHYDGRGLKTLVSHADFGEVKFAYDAAGRLTTRLDGDGNTVSTQYDLLDRPTSRRARGADGGELAPSTFLYDANKNGLGDVHTLGHLASATSEAGDVEYRYDARGRTLVERRTIDGTGSFEFGSEYDRGDRLVSRTFPDGRGLSYQYDLLDRLTQVPGHVDTLTYDPRGAVSSATMNGTELRLAYDGAGLQTGIRVLEGTRVVLERARVIDANGNPTSEHEDVTGLNHPLVSYAYDDLDRLQTMTDAAGATTYVHDAWNRLEAIQSSHAGYARSFVLGSGGTSALPRAVDGVALRWSPGGKLVNTSARTLLWDAWGRVAAIDDAAGRVSFSHDENGRLRVKQTPDTRTTLVAPDYRVAGERASIVLRVGSNLELVTQGEPHRTVTSAGIVGGSEQWQSELLGLFALASALVACSAQIKPQRAWLGASLAITVAFFAVGACHRQGSSSASSTTKGSMLRVMDWQGSPIYERTSEEQTSLTRLPFGWASPADDLARTAFLGGEPLSQRLTQVGARPFDDHLGMFLQTDDHLWELSAATLTQPRLREVVGYGANNPLRYSDPSGQSADDDAPFARSPSRMLPSFDSKVRQYGPFTFQVKSDEGEASIEIKFKLRDVSYQKGVEGTAGAAKVSAKGSLEASFSASTSDSTGVMRVGGNIHGNASISEVLRLGDKKLVAGDASVEGTIGMRRTTSFGSEGVSVTESPEVSFSEKTGGTWFSKTSEQSRSFKIIETQPTGNPWNALSLSPEPEVGRYVVP